MINRPRAILVMRCQWQCRDDFRTLPILCKRREKFKKKRWFFADTESLADEYHINIALSSPTNPTFSQMDNDNCCCHAATSLPVFSYVTDILEDSYTVYPVDLFTAPSLEIALAVKVSLAQNQLSMRMKGTVVLAIRVRFQVLQIIIYTSTILLRHSRKRLPKSDIQSKAETTIYIPVTFNAVPDLSVHNCVQKIQLNYCRTNKFQRSISWHPLSARIDTNI